MISHNALWSAVCVAALCVSGCGGDGGMATDAESAAPPIPAHASANVALTSANVPAIAANAQGTTILLRGWLVDLPPWIAQVSPAMRLASTGCGAISDPGSLVVSYLDNDQDGRTSAGDQITIVSAGTCDLDAFADGTTTLTVLKAANGAIVDEQVLAASTLDDNAMGRYDWSDRLLGRFRITTLPGGQVQVLGIGDVRMTFADGRVQLLRNLAIVVDEQGGYYHDMAHVQFDLVFLAGNLAGAQVQVDSEGMLAAEGSNTPPYPGTVLISGNGATRAQVGADNAGHFITSIDLGDGHFIAGAATDDFAFYAAAQQ